MSWISEFAGKAEDFLNKIDHNASVVLKKEKKKNKYHEPKFTSENENLFSCINTPTESSLSPPKVTPKHSSVPDKLMTPSCSVNKEKEVEDKLMQYLNSSSIDIDVIDNSKLPDQQTTTNGTTIICLPEEFESNSTKPKTRSSDDVHLERENEMLKNEVRSLNTDVSLLMSRAKTSEKETTQMKSRLSERENNLSKIEKELSSVKNRLLKFETENSDLLAENERLKMLSKNREVDDSCLLKEAEARLSQCQLDAQQREEALKEDIASLRVRISELEESLNECRKEHAAEVSELSNRLSEARTELSEYMVKATSRLALKEKVVEELRVGSNQDSLSVDVQHLKSEVDWLTEECERLRGKFEAARLEADSAEKRLEGVREEYAVNVASLQTRLSQEHARRMAAEENCSVHNQELQSVREELTRQVMLVTERVREREAELTRLRRQLAQKNVNNASTNHQEQRIAALTKALVEKELALEQVTDQRNQLRIQIDRLKNEYASCTYSTTNRGVNVNDTDDVKAQFPSIMSERPSDTMVTRRVKRAYSCVDSLGVRTGLFLRRYPLARLLLFAYIIILHLWVCLVLFSRTPDTKL